MMGRLGEQAIGYLMRGQRAVQEAAAPSDSRTNVTQKGNDV